MLSPSSWSKNKLSKKPAGSKRQNQLRLLPASASFLRGLFFDREDGGDMFLRTACRYKPEDRTNKKYINLLVSTISSLFISPHLSEE
jgi:hypothetical protein